MNVKGSYLKLMCCAAAVLQSACQLDLNIEDLDPKALQSSLVVIGPYIADGSTAATIQVLVTENGAAMAEMTPVVSVSGSGNLLGDCSPTNSSGLSTCSLRSTVAEVKTIRLISPESDESVEVEFIAPLSSSVGFSLASGGGTTSGLGVSSFSSIGLTTSPILLEEDGGPLGLYRGRMGLQGVLAGE